MLLYVLEAAFFGVERYVACSCPVLPAPSYSAAELGNVYGNQTRGVARNSVAQPNLPASIALLARNHTAAADV